jgi:hypothetical protein
VQIAAADGTTLSIPVVSYGALTAFVTSPRSAQTLVIEVSQQGYNGQFSLSFAGANSATVSPLLPSTGYGPTSAYAITDTTPGETYLLEVTGAAGTAMQTLTMQTLNVALGVIPCTFYDEAGNTLPAGAAYELYFTGEPIINASLAATLSKPGASVLPTTVASGFLGVGGTATLTLYQETSYTVLFTGNQAPAIPAYFTTQGVVSNFSISVMGYRSPNFTQTGLTQAALSLWPSGWVGEQYKSSGSGSVAWALASAINTVLAQLDQRQQIVSVSTRVDTCSGSQFVGNNPLTESPIYVDTIASWFADFFGTLLPRQTGESDVAYIARGKAALQGTYLVQVKQPGTVSGYFELPGNPGVAAVLTSGITGYASILANAQAAWNSVSNTPGANSLVVFDTTHSCTFNASTGYYEMTPVAGTQYASYVSTLSLVGPKFCVLVPTSPDLSKSFFLNDSYIGNTSYLVNYTTISAIASSSVPPLVVSAVESHRALGTVPIYGQL